MTKLPPPTNEGCASPSSGWSTYPVLLVGSDIVPLILSSLADTDLNGSPPVYRAAAPPFEQLRHPHRRVAQPLPYVGRRGAKAPSALHISLCIWPGCYPARTAS